jgi:hypothetical protein
MLRDRLDKFLNRDLGASRKRASEEGAALDKHAADLKRRTKDLERRTQQIAGHRLPDLQRQVDQHRAISLQPLGDARYAEWLSRLEVDLARLEAIQQEVNDIQQELDTERQALEAEWTQLLDDQTRVLKSLEAANVTESHRARRVGKWAFASELVTVAMGLIVPLSTPHVAHGVHLDYYSAVAEIMPVLLVAGLVEVAFLGLRSLGRWSVLNFAVPALGGTGGALYALATQHSTSSTLFLTIWGLGVTFISLTLYFIGHVESSGRTE